ncbi:MAG: nucleotidyl transferase AbiEii/AbiGii toxin family protein [Halothiobacillaceae bacterium]
MYQIANESSTRKRELFGNTALKMGVSETIVEKDFWVCFLLDVLFHHTHDATHFCFKGGTSLSKGYGVIKRFSEDIDLILDWRLLGYSRDEPWAERTKNQQDHLIEQMSQRTSKYLTEVLMPEIEGLTRTYIREKVQLHVEGSDEQTICFAYPHLFHDTYVMPEIRLEIGALAAWTPSADKMIRPYAADYYPNVFKQAETAIRTVEARRTFWEKATILHREAHRTDGRPPERYSRHYYDLYMLSQTPIKEEALEDPELLRTVVRFNEKFYPSSWARYEDATPERMRLVPSEETIARLTEDYRSMREMLFGDTPRFSTIIERLARLETEVHQMDATRRTA